MAKKRKTREQKLRAATRKTVKLASSVKSTSEPLKTPTVAKKKAPVARIAATNWPDLRWSIGLAVALVALQLTLWVVFNYTDVDNKLYEAIKL